MAQYWRGFQKFVIPIVSAVSYLRFHLTIEGRENLPEGGCVVCANHSALFDAVLVPVALTNKVMLRAMAKKELFSVWGLRTLVTWLGGFPVDRKSADMAAIKTALGTVKAGGRLVIFPQGTRADRTVPAKEGAVMVAVRSGAPIVPVYITENQHFRKRVYVTIGKPYQVEKGNRDYTAAAADLMARIYALDTH